MSQESYKICPRCQQPAALHIAQCLRCGRPFRTQFAPEDRTQVVQAAPTGYAPPARAIAPNIPLIATMWGLTLGVIAVTLYAPLLGILLDIPAFIIAIILACSKSRTDKINGGAKIGLEVLGGIVAFCIAFHAAQARSVSTLRDTPPVIYGNDAAPTFQPRSDFTPPASYALPSVLPAPPTGEVIGGGQRTRQVIDEIEIENSVTRRNGRTIRATRHPNPVGGFGAPH